jgi:hypothetical protein
LLTKLGQKIARGENPTDVVLREREPFQAEHLGAFVNTARGERDVSSDHDVVASHVLGDPVIRRIELRPHRDLFEPLAFRHPHPGVRHQEYLEPIAPGDTIDSSLHGATVGIHEEI